MMLPRAVAVVGTAIYRGSERETDSDASYEYESFCCFGSGAGFHISSRAGCDDDALFHVGLRHRPE